MYTLELIYTADRIKSASVLYAEQLNSDSIFAAYLYKTILDQTVPTVWWKHPISYHLYNFVSRPKHFFKNILPGAQHLFFDSGQIYFVLSLLLSFGIQWMILSLYHTLL